MQRSLPWITAITSRTRVQAAGGALASVLLLAGGCEVEDEIDPTAEEVDYTDEEDTAELSEASDEFVAEADAAESCPNPPLCMDACMYFADSCAAQCDADWNSYALSWPEYVDCFNDCYQWMSNCLWACAAPC